MTAKYVTLIERTMAAIDTPAARGPRIRVDLQLIADTVAPEQIIPFLNDYAGAVISAIHGKDTIEEECRFVELGANAVDAGERDRRQRIAAGVTAWYFFNCSGLETVM